MIWQGNYWKGRRRLSSPPPLLPSSLFISTFTLFFSTLFSSVLNPFFLIYLHLIKTPPTPIAPTHSHFTPHSVINSLYPSLLTSSHPATPPLLVSTLLLPSWFKYTKYWNSFHFILSSSSYPHPYYPFFTDLPPTLSLFLSWFVSTHLVPSHLPLSWFKKYVLNCESLLLHIIKPLLPPSLWSLPCTLPFLLLIPLSPRYSSPP